MALLSDNDRSTIAEMFEGLVDPVRLVYFTTPQSVLIVPGQEQCETCNDVQQLAEEVVAISDKLSLDVHNFRREPEEARKYGVTRVPTLMVMGPDDGRVRYVGAPAGYEFSNLLNDIRLISQGQTELAAETREALAAITDPVHIQVFVTPT